MKRSKPLRRKTPLRAARPKARRARRQAPPQRTRARAGADAIYLAYVHRLRCCARDIAPGTRCRGGIVAHHPRHHAPGVGRKAPDIFAISLCDGHHKELHALSGAFKGWKRDQLRSWQDGWVERTQLVVKVHVRRANDELREVGRAELRQLAEVTP